MYSSIWVKAETDSIAFKSLEKAVESLTGITHIVGYRRLFRNRLLLVMPENERGEEGHKDGGRANRGPSRSTPTERSRSDSCARQQILARFLRPTREQ
jgi:hypothetical protein